MSVPSRRARCRDEPAEMINRPDLVVIGGGVGGVAACLAALERGLRVVMTETDGWIGGQMTSQAVPPDEHPWIEQFGCTANYRRVRELIRAYYRRYYPLTDSARRARAFNPGNAFVSQICHEPRVSLAVLEGLLMPYRAGGQLELLLGYDPVAAESSGDRLQNVTVRHLDGSRRVLEAPYFIDATENGDLLPLAQIEYVTGAEAQSETGEPHAAAEAAPLNMQAVSWCFVVDYDPHGEHIIERPADYAFWRDFYPDLRPDWGSKLLSWSATHPITLEPVVRTFDPIRPKPERGPMDLWTFRRIADRNNFRRDAYASDIVLVNWPQIDYVLGTIIEVAPEERERHLQGARNLSLSMLYWMQTEAPRPDGGTGWPGLRPRPDITGAPFGLARQPYIRESRRLRARFTVLEQHVGVDARCQETGLEPDQVRAADFHDSVGIGAYRIDLHPSTGGDNYIDVGALPFQIPLGSLLPQRVRNVLAGGKNLGVTHITNGCYRLHPVEWNVGESAGALVAYCHQNRTEPQAVYEQSELLNDFQKTLIEQGVELKWPHIEQL
ncbi:MAG: FAD-dependent oxidoreductase [Candidatus Eremiobacteraeota bacterium]|nr:FAD-dependent oxidoreductase [Candidatus Eremiobacteraeota bacterium]